MGGEPKVEITMKDVYDLALQTHYAVTNFAPRLEATEKVSETALKIAQQADVRSKENRRYLSWIGKIVLTVFCGGVVAIIAASASGHLR